MMRLSKSTKDQNNPSPTVPKVRAYGEELEKHRVSQANGTSLQPRMLNGECPILTKWLFTNVLGDVVKS